MISGWIAELFSLPLNTFMRFVESSARRVLNMHHQASPVSRTPSMPAVDASYIPPVPPLIQDYRPYYPTPNDLSGKDESRRSRTSVRPCQEDVYSLSVLLMVPVLLHRAELLLFPSRRQSSGMYIIRRH